jgi:hypothetical protein
MHDEGTNEPGRDQISLLLTFLKMVYKYFFSSSAYDVFIALAIKFILKMYS